ncbi:MAG: hypothetical protein AAGC55_25845, partial [Myxococcota bacterium]
RLPRFFAVAWIGYLLPIPAWVLGLLFILLILSVVLAPLFGPGAEDDELAAMDDGGSDGASAAALLESPGLDPLDSPAGSSPGMPAVQ